MSDKVFDEKKNVRQNNAFSKNVRQRPECRQIDDKVPTNDSEGADNSDNGQRLNLVARKNTKLRAI